MRKTITVHNVEPPKFKGALLYGVFPMFDFLPAISAVTGVGLQVINLSDDYSPAIAEFWGQGEASVFSIKVQDAVNSPELLSSLSDEDRLKLEKVSRQKLPTPVWDVAQPTNTVGFSGEVCHGLR